MSQEFWATPIDDLLKQLTTSEDGLTDSEAERRLKVYGPNLMKPKRRIDAVTLFLSQLQSPIILILIFAALLSFFLKNPTDALIILTIIILSSLLGFWQEWRATNAMQKLLSMVEIKVMVVRSGKTCEIPSEKVVPGDLIILNAGDIVPADSRILESKDLFIDEATLTGETFPDEKEVGILPKDTLLSKRKNSLFMGTHVTSGTAKAIAVNTGIEAEFGKIAKTLEFRPPETEFEQEVKKFTYFLLEVTFILIITIFIINALFYRPVLESFLFALALAVGLTPQLLPAIISINLARGAARMAGQDVIVKRLASIENFGGMNVLCADKTGTLTEGVVVLNSSIDLEGQENEEVAFFAYLNACYQSGYMNPIDQAILKSVHFDTSSLKKIDEVPYDFIRKRLSILVAKGSQHLMITKGAPATMFPICSKAKTHNGKIISMSSVSKQIQNRFEKLSQEGFRILCIAYKDIYPATHISSRDESDMVFLGFLIFFDPPKSDILQAINDLKNYHIKLKIITGDNRFVAAYISRYIALSEPQIITGADLTKLSDEALIKQVNRIDIFAEVPPNQKERIITALKKSGNVVGYLGDGINDASALYAADVGISVDSAVDVVKEVADIILLRKDLNVLVQGVREGRITFVNTLKYVFMATSANFGNMFSMAGASLFLTFLPLLPKQILLANLFADIPEMTISTDRVDRELIEYPRRFDIGFIRKFMLTFGTLSSVFDFFTFFILLVVLQADPVLFRSGWFVESTVISSIDVFVIRTQKPFFRSWPSKYLSAAALLVAVTAIILPFTMLSQIFEFTALPAFFSPALGLLVVLYIIMAEMTKKVYYKLVKF